MELLKKGQIKSYPTQYTAASIVRTEKNCRSITFINVGTSTAQLYRAPTQLPIAPGGSFTLGGYDDSTRDEEIDLNFTGAGINSVIVIRDIQMDKPSWSITKK